MVLLAAVCLLISGGSPQRHADETELFSGMPKHADGLLSTSWVARASKQQLTEPLQMVQAMSSARATNAWPKLSFPPSPQEAVHQAAEREHYVSAVLGEPTVTKVKKITQLVDSAKPGSLHGQYKASTLPDPKGAVTGAQITVDSVAPFHHNGATKYLKEWVACMQETEGTGPCPAVDKWGNPANGEASSASVAGMASGSQSADSWRTGHGRAGAGGGRGGVAGGSGGGFGGGRGDGGGGRPGGCFSGVGCYLNKRHRMSICPAGSYCPPGGFKAVGCPGTRARAHFALRGSRWGSRLERCLHHRGLGHLKSKAKGRGREGEAQPGPGP